MPHGKQDILLILTISLALIILSEGVKEVSKSASFNIKEQALDDESLLYGRRSGCLGAIYILVGLVFMAIIILLYFSIYK